MNEEAHWNIIAPSYDDEIFDVFKSDKRKRLPVYFKKYANQTHHAIDFGCGTGKAFSYLSPLFRKILAIDISAECIAVAKSRGFANIEFKRLDLTKPDLRLPLTDFAFCCNVVMLPEIEKNKSMLRNIQKSLKPGGAAVFVLPSFESILFSSQRLIDWYSKEGVKPEKIPVSEFSYFNRSKVDVLQGIINISEVPTKHYLEPEIRLMFREAALSVSALERLEYDWDSEFTSPPDWMQEPYPWDWLVECRNSGC